MAVGAAVAAGVEIAEGLLDLYMKAASIAQMSPDDVKTQLDATYQKFLTENPQTDIKDL